MTVVNEAEIRKPHETLQERLAQVVELLERYDLAVEAREDHDRAPVSPADIPEEGLEELRARLDELHPADVAFILEALPQEDRLTVWGLVKTERDGEILLEVSDAVRETLIADMDDQEILAVAGQLDADELADLAPDLPRDVVHELMEALDTGPVRAVLDRATPYEETHLRLFGVPESEIAATLRDVEARTDLSRLEIVTCLRDFTLEVDVRHHADGRGARDAVVAAIEQRHGKAVFATDGSSVDEVLFELLAGHTVVTAESCTGGLLAGRLTAPPGASAHVAGGVVAYSNEAKTSQLGVPAAMIAEHGAVSPEVARALADGARERFGADIGVGITGVAGPDGGTEAKPVGYVCFCAASSDGRRLHRDPVLPGERGDVRERSVVLAMHLLLKLLEGDGG